MPWPYNKDEITSALVGKFGFEQDDRDHDFYVLGLDGRTVAYTYVSRGRRDRVSENIAFRMMREMRLNTLQQFRDAIDCPLSREEYCEQLRTQRREADEPPPVSEEPQQLDEPRQPLRWVWTITGRSFGYIQDACLFTYDGRNIARLVGGSEEIYALDGRYLGEVRNWNALVVVDERSSWTGEPARPDPPLRPVHRWPDRDALPMPGGLSDFPHPDSL
jgi:hypothetical protein